MSIRATPARCRSTLSLAAAAALSLAGCGAAAPQAKQPGAVADDDRAADCLDVVWRAQAAPDKTFDRAHDRVNGGSISCATGTSASQFAALLRAVRGSAARGDYAALTAEVGLPLLYIDRAGTKHELDRAALMAEADRVFSPPMLALLRKLQFADLTVVQREGAFAGLGAVWLVAGRTGGPPRIVTIDRKALDEAAAATQRRRTRTGE